MQFSQMQGMKPLQLAEREIIDQFIAVELNRVDVQRRSRKDLEAIDLTGVGDDLAMQLQHPLGKLSIQVCCRQWSRSIVSENLIVWLLFCGLEFGQFFAGPGRKFGVRIVVDDLLARGS